MPKGALIELTKSDWLTLEKEEDWYKFCKGWAKLRAKRILGIPEEEKKVPPVAAVVEERGILTAFSEMNGCLTQVE